MICQQRAGLDDERRSSMEHAMTLPLWLDKLIFEELKGNYQLSPKDVVYNPDQPIDFVRCYLGTYFPRSYVESYAIIGDLMENRIYFEELNGCEELNVVDFCCGTGGEIFGLISVLQHKLKHLKRIHVDAIDANPHAIRTLYKLAEQMKALHQFNIEIDWNFHCFFINNHADWADLIKMLNRPYQYIMSFKALNELIQSKVFPNENVYYKMLSMFTPLLAHNGVLLIVDVATKNDEMNLYYPQIMNMGMNHFVKEKKHFKSVIPAACYHYEQQCNACYMQDSFSVSHSRRQLDLSKVAFRIVCPSSFADQFMKQVPSTVCNGNSQFVDKSDPYRSTLK